MVAIGQLGDSEETTLRHFGVGGAVDRPIKTRKTSKMASAPHNYGLRKRAINMKAVVVKKFGIMNLLSRSLNILKQYGMTAFLKKSINYTLRECRRCLSIQDYLSRKRHATARNEYSRRELIVSYFPKDLAIETTTLCNLNCVMCWHAIGAVPDRKHLPTEQLEQLVPYLRQAEFIQLHGFGEPLLSPALWRALELIGRDAQERKCVSISTNGQLLNKDNIERLINSPLQNINVSLDAATPDTYRKIRGADFTVVLNNIRNFVRMRDQLQAKLPLLYLNMTLMKANIEELPLFIELVSQLKGDRAYFWHMSDGFDHKNVAWKVERDGWTFDYWEQVSSKYPALTNRMVRLALNRASELGVSVDTGLRNQLWLPEESQSNQSDNTPANCADYVESMKGESEECPEDSGCDAPWRWLLIHIDGRVRTCCYTHKTVGDFNKETIEQIWNGKIMQEVRARCPRRTRPSRLQRSHMQVFPRPRGATILKSVFRRSV